MVTNRRSAAGHSLGFICGSVGRNVRLAVLLFAVLLVVRRRQQVVVLCVVTQTFGQHVRASWLDPLVVAFLGAHFHEAESFIERNRRFVVRLKR